LTHTTVLIKYEGTIEEAESKVAQLLEPYDENKECEERKDFLGESDLKRMAKHYNVSLDQINALQELLLHMEDWDGTPGGIENGKLYKTTTHNEKCKWDWWTIGGRWGGKLILKPTTQGIVYSREPGPVYRPATPHVATVGTDVALLKDVDFEAMGIARRARAEEDWEALSKLAPDNPLRRFEYDAERDETKEHYIARHSAPFTTHAVLIEGQEWIEPSEMGWFGCDHDRTEDAATWAQNFQQRFLSNPTDTTVIVVVDYHI